MHIRKIKLAETMIKAKNRFIRRSRLLFSILLAVSVLTQTDAVAAYNDEQAIDTATLFLNQGEYLEAIGIYQEISELSENPDIQAKALFFIARTYSLYLDQYDTAIQQFDTIITRYPNSPVVPDAMFNSGMALFEQGKYQKAHDVFTRYLTAYPKGRHVQSAAIWADYSKILMAGVQGRPVLPEAPVVSDTMLRVLVKGERDKVTITSDKIISITSPATALYSGPGPVLISKSANYISINGRLHRTLSCRVDSGGVTMDLDNTPYRGFFTISVDPAEGGLSIVNNIQIEQYLYGVVPKEMPSGWEKQALMAQAIAARTYALYIKEKSKDKPYDVVATTLSQVYGGYGAETAQTNLAIDETKGLVMTYDGKLIVAYFHSNSGGYTEDPENVWRAAIPYLRGVPDRFSENTPGSTWEYFLSYDSAKNQLNRQGLHVGSISQINVSGKSRSGRALEMLIRSNNGTSKLTSNTFRMKIGESELKSTLFQIIPSPRGLHFRGKGFGHGVGMSQWGAKKMAQAGLNYKDILKHYYKNIKIAKIYETSVH